MKKLLLMLSLLGWVCGAASGADWKHQIAEELPLLGHRNWIVIADSAYPLQIAPGVQTVETNASQLEVLRAVLAAVDKTPHVRANIFTDSELPFVAEADAPGVGAYRDKLKEAFGGRAAASVLHAKLIQQLADAGSTFQVLLLKTNLTIPYTTVFLQLDCRYWSADAEARLRRAMQASK